MSKYVTKSCPHCGHNYQTFQPARRHYGSPFRTCQRCNRVFIDKDYEEMGLQPPNIYKVSRVSAFPVVILVVCIILAAVDPSNMAAWVIFGGPCVFLIVDDLKSYKSRLAWQQAELRKSNERLSDPMYVLAIVELGQFVPREIREKAIASIKAKTD